MLLEHHLSRVELGAKQVVMSYHADAKQPKGEHTDRPTSQIELPRTQNAASLPASPKSEMAEVSDQPDPKALQAIARAHCWMTALGDGKHASVEELAESAKLHPKVVRHGLRFAFLSPDILESVLNGDPGLT